MLEDLQFDLESSENACIPKVKAVRCAAHTLQLAVRDALREFEVLVQCRRVAKILRTPNYALLLRTNY